jgi:hypothetical protein
VNGLCTVHKSSLKVTCGCLVLGEQRVVIEHDDAIIIIRVERLKWFTGSQELNLAEDKTFKLVMVRYCQCSWTSFFWSEFTHAS